MKSIFFLIKIQGKWRINILMYVNIFLEPYLLKDIDLFIQKGELSE